MCALLPSENVTYVKRTSLRNTLQQLSYSGPGNLFIQLLPRCLWASKQSLLVRFSFDAKPNKNLRQLLAEAVAPVRVSRTDERARPGQTCARGQARCAQQGEIQHQGQRPPFSCCSSATVQQVEN